MILLLQILNCISFLILLHRRLLGYSSEMNTSGALTVSVDGREVAITCIHVGVDLPRVQQALDSR